MGLREKWFGTEEEISAQEKEISETVSALRGREAIFSRNDYVNLDFIPWLETLLTQLEPEPGTHEKMLFDSGVRKGVLLVKDHVEGVRKRVRERN